MKRVCFVAALSWLCILYTLSWAEPVTTSWGGDANIMYDTGFATAVMKHDDGGISLFDLELLENDGPGSGRSEKGISSDSVWGKFQARKLVGEQFGLTALFLHYRSPLKTHLWHVG